MIHARRPIDDLVPFRRYWMCCLIAAAVGILPVLLLTWTDWPAASGWWSRILSESAWLGQIIALVAGTFISEDLTCVAAGQFVEARRMHWGVGLLGCGAGIFIGDLGLWWVGRWAGRAGSRWPRLMRWVRRSSPGDHATLIDRHMGWAILVSRFVPGSRLPLYLGIGLFRGTGRRFAFWVAVSVILWTPIIVLGATLIARLAIHLFSDNATVWIIAAGAAYLGLRLAGTVMSERGRAGLIARFSRVWRWEFWPSWLFYLPLVPWIAWLSLRHRGFMTITAANPGIPLGGFVGESKSQILASLHSPHVLPFVLIPEGMAGNRLRCLRELVSQRGWTFPLILKPDVGQRGAGVRLVRDMAQAEEYVRTFGGPLLVQQYHSGPFEAGIFYYRLLGHDRGYIFSLTDKRFPQLLGDGLSIVEQLILRHPRYCMQSGMFLSRHHDERSRVLAQGETFRLAIAGNHCQGTLFRDGSDLITPELEETVDRIARSFVGFHFGRFDVRYSDVDQFKAGRDLAIVELNGVTSESTNLYDPSFSLLKAYRILFHQWWILFQIGSANRRLGHVPASSLALLREIWRHFRQKSVNPLSD